MTRVLGPCWLRVLGASLGLFALSGCFSGVSYGDPTGVRCEGSVQLTILPITNRQDYPIQVSVIGTAADGTTVTMARAEVEAHASKDVIARHILPPKLSVLVSYTGIDGDGRRVGGAIVSFREVVNDCV